ncbi:MAG: arylsulfatase [Sandaracinaceae bacterium]
MTSFLSPLFVLAAVPVALAQEPAPAAEDPALAEDEPASPPPNVLVEVVDDAGYSDFGAYGGDAETPAIDSLAEQGTKFSRFYATPQCGPSRSMLLTGSDNHEVGIGTINETMTASLEGLPAYAMALNPESLTLAERLRDAGYQTFATGKWGIGRPGSSLPLGHGFDHSHVLDASGADNWEQKPYIPLYDTAPWYVDGEPITLPDDFYSSEYIVDRTIELLDQADPDRPFFAYLGFQAVHVPVQVSRTYTERYAGRFDRGWDVMRLERAERARSLGLVPDGVPLAAMPRDARPWASLSSSEQARYAAMMEVYAGMLEAMDFHLGRLLAHLEQRGWRDNTLVIVVSDNGPEYSEIPAEHDFLRGPLQGPLLERLGERGTTASIGPEWATVAAAPLSLFKFFSANGGTRVPLVIAGPGVPPTDVVQARAHMTDVVPTVLDLVGVPLVPAPPGAPQVRGRSLAPALVGTVEEVYGPDDVVAMEVAGNAALYRGPYKLVRLTPPHGDGEWRLYDVDRDPGETQDLSDRLPDLKRELVQAYRTFAAEVGVAELPADYNPVRQIWFNSAKHPIGFVRFVGATMLDRHLGISVAILLGLVAAFVLLARWWFRRRARTRAGPRSGQGAREAA